MYLKYVVMSCVWFHSFLSFLAIIVLNFAALLRIPPWAFEGSEPCFVNALEELILDVLR